MTEEQLVLCRINNNRILKPIRKMRKRDGAVRKTEAGRGIIHAQDEAAGRDGAGTDVADKA